MENYLVDLVFIVYGLILGTLGNLLYSIFCILPTTFSQKKIAISGYLYNLFSFVCVTHLFVIVIQYN